MPMLRPLWNKLRGKATTDDYQSGGTPGAGQGISLENVGNSSKRRKGSDRMGLNETSIGATGMGTYWDQTKRQGSDEDVLINQAGRITVITEIETRSKRSGSFGENANGR